MTTTIPTPYDAMLREAELAYAKAPTEYTFQILANARNKDEGYRRGRDDAKAEDAALLEAAQAIKDSMTALQEMGASLAKALTSVTDAIAQAQKEEAMTTTKPNYREGLSVCRCLICGAAERYNKKTPFNVIAGRVAMVREHISFAHGQEPVPQEVAS